MNYIEHQRQILFELGDGKPRDLLFLAGDNIVQAKKIIRELVGAGIVRITDAGWELNLPADMEKNRGE